MKPLLFLPCILASALHAADDLLLFENGDQLHGSFQGIAENGGLLFRNNEMKESAEFRTESLRQLVLRGGKPEFPVENLSHVGLANGDRIPGNIVAMDETHLTLETGFAGTLRIPREQVSLLAANPMGGRVHYHGPFSKDDWNILKTTPDNLQENDKGAEGEAEAKPWEFSGSAWYWSGSKSSMISSNAPISALARDKAMTDRSVLRFRIDWKERLGASIAFHADFNTGDPANDDEAMKRSREQASFPALFGNAYVIQMYSSHLMLYRSSWDKEQGPKFDRIQNGATSMRLGDQRSAVIEIRSNRANGLISLFVNDEFISQWSEPAAGENDRESFAGKGSGFGFAAHTGTGPIRISEILVTEWNGLPDSARSMDLEDQDVVLMNNGTDRFSGKAVGLDAQGRLVFEGRHGPLLLPLDEVAEVRFARSRVAAASNGGDAAALLHINPIGRISAKILSGTPDSLKLQHPSLGALDLQTKPLVTIEYKTGNRISDHWNEDF